MINQELTRQQQHDLLNALFGFNFEDSGGGHWVLYDDDGEEFYGSNENLRFDFSTLAGIFSYTAHQAKKQGYSDCQSAMRKILGV